MLFAHHAVEVAGIRVSIKSNAPGRFRMRKLCSVSPTENLLIQGLDVLNVGNDIGNVAIQAENVATTTQLGCQFRGIDKALHLLRQCSE